MTASRSPSLEEVAGFYDLFTPMMRLIWDDNIHFGFWADADDASSVGQATDRLTDLVVEHIAAKPGSRLLDVGCGVGKPALRLARATGAEVIGISINHKEIEEASRRAWAEGPADRVSFRFADAMALPFPKESFDGAFALESIIHMDRPVALREMARVLRPGARLVLTDLFQKAPLPEELQPAAAEALDAQKLSPLPEFADFEPMVRAAGFDVEELRDISPHTGSTLPRIGRQVQQKWEAIQALGPEAVRVLQSLASPVASLPEFGYALLVARRRA
ncbi:MAG TPA: methyltransferase domain-containing protein [Actinomycetota bacterium]|jgi:ubiquinone/menaquinone biosynthesis C-methylase UbiE